MEKTELEKHFNHIIDSCSTIDSETITKYLFTMSKELNLDFYTTIDNFILYWENKIKQIKIK